MDQTTLEPTHNGVAEEGSGATVYGSHRSFSGKKVIATVVVIALVTVGVNFAMARKNSDSARIRQVDNAQLADPSRTTQNWKMLPDGLVATFTAKNNDPEVEERIRRNLKFRRTEYLRANYSDPKFGNEQIPGRADLEFGTAHETLNCRYRDVPGGGELRWITSDSVMLESLEEWATEVAAGPIG